MNARAAYVCRGSVREERNDAIEDDDNPSFLLPMVAGGFCASLTSRSSLTHVVCAVMGRWPDEAIPGLDEIKYATFYDCSQLKTVNLDEGVEEIGESAFEGCTSIYEILIPPAVKSIMGGAFGRCSQLTTVILGEGLEEIGKSAFGDCRSLHEISIPPRC
jgi:hypothetical protein